MPNPNLDFKLDDKNGNTKFHLSARFKFLINWLSPTKTIPTPDLKLSPLKKLIDDQEEGEIKTAWTEYHLAFSELVKKTKKQKSRKLDPLLLELSKASLLFIEGHQIGSFAKQVSDIIAKPQYQKIINNDGWIKKAIKKFVNAVYACFGWDNKFFIAKTEITKLKQQAEKIPFVKKTRLDPIKPRWSHRLHKISDNVNKKSIQKHIADLGKNHIIELKNDGWVELSQQQMALGLLHTQIRSIHPRYTSNTQFRKWKKFTTILGQSNVDTITLSSFSNSRQLTPYQIYWMMAQLQHTHVLAIQFFGPILANMTGEQVAALMLGLKVAGVKSISIKLSQLFHWRIAQIRTFIHGLQAASNIQILSIVYSDISQWASTDPKWLTEFFSGLKKSNIHTLKLVDLNLSAKTPSEIYQLMSQLKFHTLDIGYCELAGLSVERLMAFMLGLRKADVKHLISDCGAIESVFRHSLLAKIFGKYLAKTSVEVLEMGTSYVWSPNPAELFLRTLSPKIHTLIATSDMFCSNLEVNMKKIANSFNHNHVRSLAIQCFSVMTGSDVLLEYITSQSIRELTLHAFRLVDHGKVLKKCLSQTQIDTLNVEIIPPRSGDIVNTEHALFYSLFQALQFEFKKPRTRDELPNVPGFTLNLTGSNLYALIQQDKMLIFTAGLSRSRVTTLNISDTNLGSMSDEQLLQFAKALSKCNRLQTVIIENNGLTLQQEKLFKWQLGPNRICQFLLGSDIRNRGTAKKPNPIYASFFHNPNSGGDAADKVTSLIEEFASVKVQARSSRFKN